MGRPLSTLPTRTRPRERLLAEGREALSDTELLALQLRSGTSGTSACDLAAHLLAEFGSLRALSEASVEELARLPGVGVAKAANLVAGFELGRRLPFEDQSEIRMARASDVAQRAQGCLAGLRRERVIVFVCDQRALLRHEVQLSQGTATRSLIEVREVINAVLRRDGAAFALAHNHPSGDPSPSEADTKITQDVAIAARTVGLRFLGHVVVAGNAWEEVPIKPIPRTPY